MNAHIWQILIVVILSTACEKSINCSDQVDENKSEVIRSIDVECFFQLTAGQVVLKSQEEYSAIQIQATMQGDCNFPNVDFEQYSIVGLVTQSTGCSRTYLRSFAKSDNNNYLYKVTVRECGQCEPLELNNNLVLVPKLDEASIVEFKTETTKN